MFKNEDNVLIKLDLSEQINSVAVINTPNKPNDNWFE